MKKRVIDNTVIIVAILAAIILSLSFFTLGGDKEKPTTYRDADRISVSVNTDILLESWEQYSYKDDWGDMDTEPWYQLFDREFVIEASKGQRFYDIIEGDGAAKKIASDFPDFFTYKEDGDKCRFTMEREQQGDYVVMPTWILAELIKGNIMKLEQ